MVDQREVEKRIEALKLKHEQDLRNVQNVSKHMAFDFFKSKAASNNEQYQREMKRVLYEFDDVRRKFFVDEKKILQLVNIATRQERIVKELKVFICESLEKIFHKVETKNFEIIKTVEEKLPTYQHSRIGQIKENPFALYCSYIDYCRPVELEEIDKERKEMIDLLIEENKRRTADFDACNLVCEKFLLDEEGYRAEIARL